MTTSNDLTTEPEPQWRAGPVLPHHKDAMRELFQVVFGTPMSDALWNWKYANGRGVAMGVWNVQDELVAHYAGFPRQVLMFGKPVTAMQMGDVMVRPNERGTLSRKGPFFLATSAFLTRYVGYDQAALLGYGFPNDRHMQLGAKRGLYERNGKVVNLHCKAQRSALPWWLATRPFLPTETGWQRKVDQLWAKMAQATADAVIPLRNSDWIRQRFLEHPTLPYELTWLYHRVSRKPLALLVYRRKAGDIEWIDLIAAPVDWPHCARAMQGIAAALEATSINLWISAAYANRFGGNTTTTDLGITIPCNTWTPGPTPETTRDQWLLTGGDTDFL